jgi:hypothetical protein
MQWIEDLDEVTVALEQDGDLVVRQEARAVLSRGPWPVLAFLYRERDRDGAFGPPRVTLRKFRRQHDAWRPESKLNLSLEEARALSEALAGWIETVSGDA